MTILRFFRPGHPTYRTRLRWNGMARITMDRPSWIFYVAKGVGISVLSRRITDGTRLLYYTRWSRQV